MDGDVAIENAHVARRAADGRRSGYQPMIAARNCFGGSTAQRNQESGKVTARSGA